MGLENIPRCDQCGIIKQEANHWLMATIKDEVRGPAQGTHWHVLVIRIMDFNVKTAKCKKAFCGNPCFLQMLSAGLPLPTGVI